MNALVLKEVWRDIEGFEGIYQVSNLGRVKSFVGWDGKQHIKREKILKPSRADDGRIIVSLTKDGKHYFPRLHRLIAKAFIPNPCGYDTINHIDSNPSNNDISNLEWCSQKYNVIHGYKYGNHKVLIKRTSDKAIRDLYLKGFTLNQIASMFGTSTSPIIDSLNRTDTVRRNRGNYEDKYHIDLIELKRLFDLGYSNKEISKAYKCPSNLIARRRYQYKKGEI